MIGVSVHWGTVAEGAVKRGACQDPRELAPLLELVHAERPQVLLEIGTSGGGTFWAFCRAAPPAATLVSLDLGPLHPEGHTYITPEGLAALGQPGQTVHQVYADSQLVETRDRVAELCPDGIDLLFIDADHRLDQVTRDHTLYSPLMNEDGIVAFHDIYGVNPITEVRHLWSALQPRMGECWEWGTPGSDTFGIGAYRAPLEAL